MDKLSSVNWLDVVIAIPIIIAMAKGAWRGLILEVASFLGLIGGIVAGVLFLDQIRNFLQTFLQLNETYLSIIAFIIIFSCVVLGVSLLGKLATKLFEIAALGILNRLGGLLFGFISSFLLVGLGILMLEKVDVSFNILPNEIKEASLFYEPISLVIPQLLDVFNMYEWQEILHPSAIFKAK
ncbi:MAG: CvpA family protein [Flavobacteriales bacterium]